MSASFDDKDILEHIFKLSELQQQNAHDIKELVHSVSVLTKDLKTLVEEFHSVSTSVSEFQVKQNVLVDRVAKIEIKQEDFIKFLLKSFGTILIAGALAGYIFFNKG